MRFLDEFMRKLGLVKLELVEDAGRKKQGLPFRELRDEWWKALVSDVYR